MVADLGLKELASVENKVMFMPKGRVVKINKDEAARRYIISDD
jgi:hypothetical protein